VSGQVELHKKELNFWVKSSVRLTNSDWHDGYMEQNEKSKNTSHVQANSYMMAKFVRATMRLCVQVHV